MSRILFLGSIQWGRPSTGGGAQSKNQHFLNFLLENYDDVKYLDVWGMNVGIALIKTLLMVLLENKNTAIIVSMSSRFSTYITRFCQLLHLKRRIFLWVIGGEFPEIIRKYSSKRKMSLNYCEKILVQGDYIKEAIEIQGIRNVKVVANFKKQIYHPKPKNSSDNRLHCVYLSRLIPEKGVDVIIEAVKQINNPLISVDFYGALSSHYSEDYFLEFEKYRIKYNGFLDLKEISGYEILASYDVMLFPTFFKGEGFPGVLIDAFMAGIPVITTDFQVNSEIVKDRENGLLIKPNDVHSLIDALNTLLYDVELRIKLCDNAAKSSKKYDINSVLPEVFKDLNIP